ncbi:MAG TPA: hypothetical protein VHC63_02460 [Acidimicrobiales bacterium]|nr:hypothetical protein [Acidimicrobiales bacterium]
MTATRTRAVAVVVIVIAFVALATFALLARAYRPGRDGVRVPDGSLGITTPRLAQPIAASLPEPAPAVLGAALDAPALSTRAPAPSAPDSPPAPSSRGGSVALAACELGLPVPMQQAGLANLVTLVPAFGPFSPEAFAMVPAFAPAFPLFGPMIIAGGQQLDAHADQVNTAIAVLHPLEQRGFDTLAPVYGPHRDQVLAGETQVASTVEPGVAAFAALPGATCLPAALALVF